MLFYEKSCIQQIAERVKVAVRLMTRIIMIEGNITSSISLEKLIHEKLAVEVPTIVWLCVLAVVGLVGNVFVVAVFGFRMKKRSTYRHFILVLAVYDLVACSLGLPGLTAELGTPYQFYSGLGCKLLRYGMHVIEYGCSVTHIMVGIDRHRRICRPTGAQMSVSRSQLYSLCVVAMTVIFALPVAVMYDSTLMETGAANVSGTECYISSKYQGTALPLVFNGILSVFTILTAVILIVLYSLIGHKICNHVDFLKHIEHTSSGNDLDTRRTSVFTKNKNKVEPVATTSNVENTALESVANEQYQGDGVINAKNQGQSFHLRQKISREMLSRKMTIVTFVMMVVFVVSFVPLQILELVTLSKKLEEDEMTSTQLVFYELGYHTYVINHAANPLVYLFMDVEFRKHCKRMFGRLKCKC